MLFNYDFAFDLLHVPRTQIVFYELSFIVLFFFSNFSKFVFCIVLNFDFLECKWFIDFLLKEWEEK